MRSNPLRLTLPPLAGVLVVLSLLGLAADRTGAGNRAPDNPAFSALAETLVRQPSQVLPASGILQVADEVAGEVAALRGWAFKAPVSKEITSPKALGPYLQREIDTNLPPGRRQRVQAFLRTIGLLPPDCDLKATLLRLLENQVGGFYDSETKILHLVERPGMSLPIERVVLAHELTHALDDQQVGLDRFVKANAHQSEDMDLVTMSIGEGSATSLMIQYIAALQAADRLSFEDLQQYGRAELERSKPFLDAPRYFSMMLGSYVCGTEFLGRSNLLTQALASDNRAVGDNLQAAVKDPPRSTEQILHPAKYWDRAARDEPVVVDDTSATAWLRQPGRWVVHRDTIGEMLVALLTTPARELPDLLDMQTAADWTNTAATGWGGDRFFLLASGASAEQAGRALTRLEGVWVTAWDTPRDRDEFLAALAKRPDAGRYATALVGSKATVVFLGVSDEERGRLGDRLRTTPLRFTRDGKPWEPQ